MGGENSPRSGLVSRLRDGRFRPEGQRGCVCALEGKAIYVKQAGVSGNSH